jgi:dermatan 4-sulfotransferase 1
VDAERKEERNILACPDMHFGMSFEDFVEKGCDLPGRQIDRHLRSQRWFLHDDRVFPTFVGKMERFPDDWQRLREMIHVLGEAGHANKAAFGADYASHCTSA